MKKNLMLGAKTVTGWGQHAFQGYVALWCGAPMRPAEALLIPERERQTTIDEYRVHIFQLQTPR